MPAPSNRPDRKRGDRRDNRRAHREPSEYEDATLAVDRVTRVVKGGRRLRFRAVVVVGNKRGKVGLGTGKATEVQAAVQKAQRAAKRNIIMVPMNDHTIPHEVNMKHKAARLRLMPASKGTGIVAGGPLRVILDLAGVKDILAKRFGTANKLVNAQAAIMALLLLRPVKGQQAAMAAAVPQTPTGSMPKGPSSMPPSDDMPNAEPNLPIKEVSMGRTEHEKKEREKMKKINS